MKSKLLQINSWLVGFVGCSVLLYACGKNGKNGTNGTNGSNGTNGTNAPTVVSVSETTCLTAADTFYIAYNSAIIDTTETTCQRFLYWDCFGNQTDCTNQTGRVCSSACIAPPCESVDLGDGSAWTGTSLADNCHRLTISYCRLGCD